MIGQDPIIRRRSYHVSSPRSLLSINVSYLKYPSECFAVTYVIRRHPLLFFTILLLSLYVRVLFKNPRQGLNVGQFQKLICQPIRKLHYSLLNSHVKFLKVNDYITINTFCYNTQIAKPKYNTFANTYFLCALISFLVILFVNKSGLLFNSVVKVSIPANSSSPDRPESVHIISSLSKTIQLFVTTTNFIINLSFLRSVFLILNTLSGVAALHFLSSSLFILLYES